MCVYILIYIYIYICAYNYNSNKHILAAIVFSSIRFQNLVRYILVSASLFFITICFQLFMKYGYFYLINQNSRFKERTPPEN